MKIDSIKKMTEIMVFIKSVMRNKKSINIYDIHNILYVAEKFHLRKFGRFILDGKYSGTPNGPISHTLNTFLSNYVENNMVDMDAFYRKLNKKELSISEKLMLESNIIGYMNHGIKPIEEYSKDKAWEKSFFKYQNLMTIESIVKCSCPEDWQDLLNYINENGNNIGE